MARNTLTLNADGTLDGVQMAIINKRMEAICAKMANTLLRTGRSGVLNSARDFSCCIVTAENRLLTVNESLPIHVLRGADMMCESMQEFHTDLKRGDAYLHNSPYHGCSHPADHTILAPVIDDEGVHRFTMVAKAHQADCGNSIATTYHGSARDVYEEGALIFPAVQIQRDYEDIEDIVRMCRLRIRVPEQWWGDYLAELGAARIGERELLAFGNEIGWDTLAQFAEQWFDYSEQLMIAAVRKMPGGRAVTTSMHDPFPNAEDGIPVKIVVEVDPEEAMVDIDLRDNPDAMPCGLNLSQACCESTLLLGVFNSIPDAVPTNTGSFRRVRMHLKENTVCGIPRHPTSCSVATTNLADRVGNAVSRAIADLGDGYGMASTASIIPPSLGVISGTSEKTKGAYVNQIFLGWGGGAASAQADAWLSIGHLGNAGMSYQDSIELDEMRFPLTVRGRHFITDSGGHGRTRGGAGVYCEFGPTEGDLGGRLRQRRQYHGARGRTRRHRRRARQPIPARCQRRSAPARPLRPGDHPRGPHHRLLLLRRRRLRRADRAPGGAGCDRRARALGLPRSRPRHLPRRPRRRRRPRPGLNGAAARRLSGGRLWFFVTAAPSPSGSSSRV